MKKNMPKTEVTAEIICVGSELLLGAIINTNASYLAKRLASLGINLFHQSVIGDNPSRLHDAIKNALKRSDIVITSGGLGPTVDDITIAAIAKAASRTLILNKTILKNMEERFRKRRVNMLGYNRRQAHIPEGAIAIKNPNGTAPASITEIGNKAIIALPGPPRELIPLFEDDIIPYLRRRYGAQSIILTRTIRTTSSAEALVNKKIEPFLKLSGDVMVGIYSRLGEVEIKITAKSEDKKTAISKIKRVEDKMVRILGDIVYGFDDDTLESVVGRMLAKKGLTLATAESCTGGLIANRITDISGSSRYFKTGIIAYSNESKMRELGVPEALIKRYGAVSKETAVAMANGARSKSGSDIAISATGIAGPEGETAKKPVGLVYIALSRHGGTRCKEFRFLGNRLDIKNQTATAALNALRHAIS